MKLNRLVGRVAGFVVAISAATAAHAEIFLQLAGVPGGAKDPAHKDWIEIDAAYEEYENGAAGVSAAGGAGAGKATFKEFTITKKTDTASPKLREALVGGRAIPTAELHFVRPGESAPFLKVTLSRVFVSSIKAQLDDVDSSETISFKAATAAWSYAGVDASGRGTAEVATSWNFQANRAN